MKCTLKLKNPIMINNSRVTELDYDSNEITAVMFAEAEAKRKIAAGTRNVAIVPAIEFDFGLHLYLGFEAIVAVNPGIDISDLERIHGIDIMEVMTIGRNFTLKREQSEPDSSDEQSETMQEPIIQASQNSNDGE